ILFERVVELTLECLRGGIREMVVVDGVLAGLVGDGARVLLVEVLDRRDDTAAFFEEGLAKATRVDARHRRSFPAAEDRRRSIWDGPMPASSTILSRPPCPETSVTASRGTDNVSASSRTTASLARPPSGGAATRTFHASPCRPMIPAREAPGATRSRTRVETTVMGLSLAASGRLDPGFGGRLLVHKRQCRPQDGAHPAHFGEQAVMVATCAT